MNLYRAYALAAQRLVVNMILVLGLMSLWGCAGTPVNSPTDQPLVGLWSEHSENVSALILRNADGTYSAKKIQRYDLAKPSIHYVESGMWSLKGQHYWFRIDYI